MRNDLSSKRQQLPRGNVYAYFQHAVRGHDELTQFVAEPPDIPASLMHA